MSRDTRKGGQKFGPPKHPIQVEATLKTIQPTHTHTSHRLKAYGTRVLAYNADPDIRAGIAHQLAADDWQERKEIIDTEFKDGFDAWLAGNSKWNNKKCFTPWERQPLFHVPGVVKYFDQQIDVHENFRKCLLDLQRNGPQNINQAYLYYKYIVRARDWRVENSDGSMTDPPWFSLAGKLDFLDKFSMDGTENHVDDQDTEKYDENTAQAQTRSSQTLSEANTEQSDTYETLPPYGAHAGAYMAAIAQRRRGGNAPVAPSAPVVQDPALLKQLEDYAKQMENLNKKLQAQDKTAREDAQARDKLQAELRKARQELGAAQKGLSGTKTSNDTLTADRDRLAKRVTDLEAAQRALDAKAAKRKREYDDMAAKYAADRVTLGQRAQELNALRTERDRYKGDAEKYKKDLDAKTIELANAAKRTVDTANKGQQELAAKIAEQNEELEKLRKQAADSEKDANAMIDLQSQIDEREARLRGYARQEQRLRQIQELADRLNRTALAPEQRVSYAQQLEALTRQLERNSEDGTPSRGQNERVQINTELNKTRADLAAAMAAYDAIPADTPAFDREQAEREIAGLVQLVEEQTRTAENLEALARGPRPEVPDAASNSPPLVPPTVDFSRIRIAAQPRGRGVFIPATPSGFGVDIVVDPETGIPYSGQDIPPSDRDAVERHSGVVTEMERWVQYLEDPDAFTQQYATEPPPITDPTADEKYLRAYPYVISSGIGLINTIQDNAGTYTALAADIPPPPAMHYATYRAVKYRYTVDNAIDYARMESELGSAVADEVYYADDFYKRAQQLLQQTPAYDIYRFASATDQNMENLADVYFPGTTQKPRIYRSMPSEINNLLYSPETRAMILPKVKAALEAYKYDHDFALRYRDGFTTEQLGSGLVKLRDTLANDGLLTAGTTRPTGPAYNPATYRAEMIAAIQANAARDFAAADEAGRAGRDLTDSVYEATQVYERTLQDAQAAGRAMYRLEEYERDRAARESIVSEQDIATALEAGQATADLDEFSVMATLRDFQATFSDKPDSYQRHITEAFWAGRSNYKLAAYNEKRASLRSTADALDYDIAFEAGRTGANWRDAFPDEADRTTKQHNLELYLKKIDSISEMTRANRANSQFARRINDDRYRQSTARSSTIQMDADEPPANSTTAGEDHIRMQRMQEREFYDNAPENARQARRVVQEASERIDLLRAELAAAQAPPTTPLVTREAQAAQVELLRGQVEELTARLQSVSGDTPFADYIESLRKVIEPLRAGSGTSPLDDSNGDRRDDGNTASTEEVARMARELEKRTKEFAKLKEAYDESVAAGALGKESLEKAQAEIETLTGKRKKLLSQQRKKTREFESKISTLQQEIDNRQAEIKKLTDTTAGKDEAVRAAEEKIALLKEQHEHTIGELRRQLQQSQSESLATSVKNATDAVGEQYRKQLQEQIAAVESDYKQRLAQAVKQTTDVRAEGMRLLSEKDVEINALVQRQTALERERTDYQQRLASLEQERTQLLQNKSRLESDIGAMNEYGTRLQTEHEEAKQRLLRGEQMYAQVTESLQAERTKLATAESNLNLTAEDRARLITQANEKIAELLQQQAQATQKQASAREHILTLGRRIEADRDRLAGELARVNAQLTALNEQQQTDRTAYNASISDAELRVLQAQTALTTEQAARVAAEQAVQQGQAETDRLQRLIADSQRLAAERQQLIQLREAEVSRQAEEIRGFDERVQRSVLAERQRLQQQFNDSQQRQEEIHREAMEDLRRQLTTTQQAKAEVEASITSLNGNAELLSRQIAELTQQAANAQAADRVTLQDQITRLSGELGQTQTRLEETLRELATTSLDKSNIETSMQQLQAQFNSATAEREAAVQAVQERLTASLAENTRLTSEVAALNTAKAAVETRLAASTLQVNEYEETIQQLRLTVAEHNETIRLAKIAFDKGNADVAALQLQLLTQQQNITELQTSIDEKVAQLASMSDTVAERDRALDELRELRSTHSALLQTKEALQESLVQSLDMLETKKQDVVKANDALATANAQVAEMTGQLVLSQAEKARFEQLANTTDERLTAANAQIQQLQEQVRVRDILPDAYRLAEISSAPELYSGGPATEATMRALRLDVERYQQQTARLTAESSQAAKQAALINGLTAAYAIMRQNASAANNPDLQASILPPDDVLQALNAADEAGAFNTPDTLITRDFARSLLQSSPIPETVALQRLGIEVGLFRETELMGSTVRVPVIREVNVEDLTGMQDWPSGRELVDIQYAVYRDGIDLVALFNQEWDKMELHNDTLHAYSNVFTTLEGNQEQLKDPETRRATLLALKRAADTARGLQAISARMDQLLEVNQRVTDMADDIGKVYTIMNSLRTTQEQSREIASQLALAAQSPEIGSETVAYALELTRQRRVQREHAAEQLQLLRSILSDNNNRDIRHSLAQLGVTLPDDADLGVMTQQYLSAYFGLESVIDGDPLGNYVLKTNAITYNPDDPITEAFWSARARRSPGTVYTDSGKRRRADVEDLVDQYRPAPVGLSVDVRRRARAGAV